MDKNVQGPAREHSWPGPAIELRHLRYFIAVSEELHFHRAAERLHVSQPPLSQAIRKLEDELGVPLLYRTSRVVTPTEAGRVFAESARKVLACMEEAVAEARRAGGATSGLRVGCVPHLPIDRLLCLLSALRELDPASLAEVTHLLAVEQAKRLRAGELDVGIFHQVDEYDDELELEPLFPGEPLSVYLAPDHHLAQERALGPADLSDESQVTFPRTANPPLFDRLQGLIEGAGYRFRTVYEAGGLNDRDVLLAVAQGLGVALLPFSIKNVSDVGSIVVRRPLDPPLSMPDTVVAWRRDPPHHLRMVLSAIREIARTFRHGQGALASG